MEIIFCFHWFFLNPDSYNFIWIQVSRSSPTSETDPDPRKKYGSGGSGTLHAEKWLDLLSWSSSQKGNGLSSTVQTSACNDYPNFWIWLIDWAVGKIFDLKLGEESAGELRDRRWWRQQRGKGLRRRAGQEYAVVATAVQHRIVRQPRGQEGRGGRGVVVTGRVVLIGGGGGEPWWGRLAGMTTDASVVGWGGQSAPRTRKDDFR